jgi:hypothetical protein
LTEYTEFVSSLSLEEQYKMPLTEADLESFNVLIDQFINYEAAGLDLLPITFTNIKSNAIEFSKRISATFVLQPSALNRVKQKLTLAIPLMKNKDAETAKLLEKNLKDTISFLKEHAPQIEFGLSLAADPKSPDPILESKKRLRGVNSAEEQAVVDVGVKQIIDNLHKRPCDQRRPKEIDDIFNYVKDTFDGKASKDPYTKNLDDFLVASLQKMQEDQTQLEMSKAKAIELSNFKKQTKLKEADAKSKRMNSAIDFLMESCKKRNKGED